MGILHESDSYNHPDMSYGCGAILMNFASPDNTTIRNGFKISISAGVKTLPLLFFIPLFRIKGYFHHMIYSGWGVSFKTHSCIIEAFKILMLSISKGSR
jgi:hypothetical protein